MMSNITIGLTLIGVAIFLTGFLGANGAVQEADAAAVGMLFAVAPYVIYKVIHCEKMAAGQKTLISLLASPRDGKAEVSSTGKE